MKSIRVLLAFLFVFVCALSYAQEPSNIEVGLKPYGSYHGGDLDSVSLTNGNLSVHIPLFAYAQRGNVSVDYHVKWNAKQWFWYEKCDDISQICTGLWTPRGGNGVNVASSSGMTVQATQIDESYDWTDETGRVHHQIVIRYEYSLLTSDGSSHRLVKVGPIYRSNDASGFMAQIDTQPYWVKDRNGVTYSPDYSVQYLKGIYSSLPSAAPPFSPTEDSNGNRIGGDWTGGGFEDQTNLTDTLERAYASLAVTRGADLSPCNQIAYASGLPLPTWAKQKQFLVPAGKGDNGTDTANVTFCYTTVHIYKGAKSPDYGQNYDKDVSVLQSIIYPNATAWSFRYESGTGNLTQIILPTGGSVSYVWGEVSLCNDDPREAVLQRTVDDGTGPKTWTYDWRPSQTPMVNTVTDPEGNRVRHTFNDFGKCSYYETKTETFTAGSGTPARTVDTVYQYTGGGVGYPANVVPSTVTATLDDGKQSKFVNKYDTFTCGTQSCILGNVTEKTEYDYGNSTVLRYTKTTYKALEDSTYADANLLDLPSSVLVAASSSATPSSCTSDGAGAARCSYTTYGYDESTLDSSGIVSQSLNAYPAGKRGNLTSILRWRNGAAYANTYNYYNDAGMLTRTQDPGGHVTKYDYDLAYKGAYATKTTLPDLTYTTNVYDFNTGAVTTSTDVNRQTKNFYYDVLSRLRRTENPDGGWTRFDYQDVVPNPNVTITTAVSPSGTPATIQTTAFVDGLGRLKQTQMTDPESTVFQDTAYDGVGNVKSTSNPYRSTSDETYGATTFKYDGLKRKTRISPPDASDTANYAGISYWGNVVTTTDQALKQRNTYSDPLGRLIRVDEPGPSPIPGSGYVDITGSVGSGKQCVRDDDTGILKCTIVYNTGTASISVGGVVSSYSFGVETAQVVASKLANAINNNSGSLVSASASGTRITLTSKLGGSNTNYSISTSCDGGPYPPFRGAAFAFKPSAATLTGGTDGSSSSLALYTPATTLYTYDALGNLISVVQKGNVTDSTRWRTRTFTYDALSRLLTAVNPETGIGTDPNSGTISYTYDVDGNVLTKVSPKPNQTSSSVKQTISYAYDNMHRMCGKQYSGTASCSNPTALNVQYIYNDPNGMISTFPIGRRTGMRDASGTTAWSYDKMGRVRVEQRTISGAIKYTVHNYNLDGSVQSIAYPTDLGTSRRIVTFQQNGAGRVTSISDDAGTQYVSNVTYWPTGAVKEAQYGSNIKIKDSYNKRLQPTTLSASASIIGGLNTIFSRTYDFHINTGNNGNVWSMTDGLDGTNSRPNGTVVYTYDNLNRLLSAQTTGSDCTVTPSGQTKNWGTWYDIDIWGNLSKKTPTLCSSETLTESVDGRNHFTPETRYDAAGNLTENGLYTYDAENRIATAGGSAYVYDGDGARVKKTGMMYWSGVSESDAAGTITADYVFLNGKRIARIEGSDIHYYLSDLLGSTSLVTDKDENVVQESQYFPYGGQIPLVNQDSNRFKFTGKERDPETGLDYFGARYYGSSIGRFMTPDPANVTDQVLALPQRWNKYAYVINNPLTRVDVGGLSDVLIHIVRQTETQHSTTGTITVSSNQNDTVVRGHSLEPPSKPDPKGNGSVRMPEGVYDAKKINPKTQSRVGAIVEVDVPGHTNVRIHPGNTAKDTEGCTLPGRTLGTDSVGDSRAMVAEIDKYVNGVISADKKNGEATNITVVYTDPTGSALKPVELTPTPSPATSPFSQVDNGIPKDAALPGAFGRERETM